MAEESYWVKREKEHIKREQMKDEEVSQRLREIIDQALRESEKEIQAFYASYADSRGLTPAEAKQRVSEMDIQRYEKMAARYVREREFSAEANEMLHTYNTNMYINRQELLMMYLNAHLVAMADEQTKTFQAYLEQAGIGEVLRQAGILGADITITTATLQSLVGASFYGATWSTRIWDDMEALRGELETIINSSIIRGVHPNRFISKVRERFDVTDFEARRLLITEVSRVQVEAQKLSFKALTDGDPEAEYEYVAMIDHRTSRECRGMDGKRFKVSEMAVGINAPPLPELYSIAHP
ncbi:minor capsid protein [Halobacillus massiliensis]|uniref:minor capsid protein n=1 Tax=Halobacillus massiliensis TaxID=1926286 RepID=UPI0009E64515|nr:minor capsid protein [Halobacillus massiliensis]